MVKRIVILGAASAIAEAAARIWAGEGARLALIGRDRERLAAIGSDLKQRGADAVIELELDCAKANAETRLSEMVAALGGLDILVLAYGVLGDQAKITTDAVALAGIIETNFTSAASWCIAASGLLAKQRSGTLIVIGSVAGDRGRRSNYVYGATKGGLACLVEGIAHHLAPLGARAVVIKPGFVDTPMTASFEKKGLLWSNPEKIAAAIVKAAQTGGPVIYAPAYWQLIMLVIRHLPAFVFNKLNI